MRHRLAALDHPAQQAGRGSAGYAIRAADVRVRLRPDNILYYSSQNLVSVDTDIFVTAKKFAQATPEIGHISTWYRQDVPQSIERIDSLVLALKHTDKVNGIEAIDPAIRAIWRAPSVLRPH